MLRPDSHAAGPFPCAIFGRLDAVRDFTCVQRSKLAPPEGLHDEASRLAIDWWGSRPQDVPFDVDELGHFPSLIQPGWFHVIQVCPTRGHRQPTRCVVTVQED